MHWNGGNDLKKFIEEKNCWYHFSPEFVNVIMFCNSTERRKGKYVVFPGILACANRKDIKESKAFYHNPLILHNI
jgi:hypothetical protein